MATNGNIKSALCTILTQTQCRPLSAGSLARGTSVASQPEVWYTTMGHRAIVLQLKSLAEAHVILATVPGLVKLSAYDIAIGAAGNTKTSITRKSRQTKTVVASSDDVLDPGSMRLDLNGVRKWCTV